MPPSVRAARVSRAVAAAVVVVAVPLSVLPAPAAFAANPNTTAAIDQTQSKLDALGVRADQAVEAYNQAQIALTTATDRAKAEEAAMAKVRARLDDAKQGVASLAVSEYIGGSSSAAMAFLVSDDPQSAVRRADMLHQISNYRNVALTEVVNANRALAQTETAAKQALAAQQAAAAGVSKRKAEVEKVIAAQQAMLDKLQAQAKREDAAARARAARLAVSRAQARVPLAASAPTLSEAVAHLGSGGAAAALKFAYAQLGKPYGWGAAGPYRYDCSGLTMRAWAAGGVALAHSSSAQLHEGRRVPLSQLQPGDLVFWGRPAYHVAIYIGHGAVIAAPHTGTVVQIQAIWGHPSGAIRP